MKKATGLFTPRAPRSIGKLERMLLQVDELKSLFSNQAYVYPGQRNHAKNQKKRLHTKGVLKGNSQQFAGVYVEDVKRYFNLDGYHRGQAVIDELAFFLPGADIELTIHRVACMKDADALYDQFNSATAAKKSGCYFESGQREAKLTLTSIWTTTGGIVSGLQYAADLKGTVATKQATVKMRQGLELCDKMKLPVTSHVKSGVKGALITIAQHAQDKSLSKTFIRAICDDEFDEPLKPTPAERHILTLRQSLISGAFGGSGGGAAATLLKFQMTLGAYVAYSLASKSRKNVALVPYTVAEFIEKMKAMPAKAA